MVVNAGMDNAGMELGFVHFLCGVVRHLASMLKASRLKAPRFNGFHLGLGHWCVAGPSFRQARSTTETYKSPSMTGTDDERGVFFIKDVVDPVR